MPDLAGCMSFLAVYPVYPIYSTSHSTRKLIFANLRFSLSLRKPTNTKICIFFMSGKIHLGAGQAFTVIGLLQSYAAVAFSCLRRVPSYPRHKDLALILVGTYL